MNTIQLEKWQEIYTFDKNGWFNYKNLYDMVSEETSGPLVEVGVWQGMSLSYLSMANPSRNVYGVDTFKGDPNNPNEQRIIKEGNLNLLEITRSNLKALSLENHNLIISDSVEASKLFEDGSLGFVFIDAGHMYDQVKADIHAWIPKVKNGGIIAGHDYDAPGVKNAVGECIVDVQKMDTCWFKKL